LATLPETGRRVRRRWWDTGSSILARDRSLLRRPAGRSGDPWRRGSVDEHVIV
jgi:hypothetical protein